MLALTESIERINIQASNGLHTQFLICIGNCMASHKISAQVIMCFWNDRNISCIFDVQFYFLCRIHHREGGYGTPIERIEDRDQMRWDLCLNSFSWTIPLDFFFCWFVVQGCKRLTVWSRTFQILQIISSVSRRSHTWVRTGHTELKKNVHVPSV